MFLGVESGPVMLWFCDGSPELRSRLIVGLLFLGLLTVGLWV